MHVWFPITDVKVFLIYTNNQRNIVLGMILINNRDV